MIDFETALNRRTYFVEVILPLNLKGSFTYRVPFDFNDKVEVGKRVIVQFGKSKIYTAIIISISEKSPSDYEAKYLLDIIDDKPILNQKQLDFYFWMADYYLCEWGEVLQAALPTALKLASETRVILNADASFNKADLTDKEFLIVDALELKAELLVSEISKIINQKNVFSILRQLFDKGIIHIYEEINQKFRAKKIAVIQLNSYYTDKENLKQLFVILEKSPKQLDILLSYLKLRKQNTTVSKKLLIEESACSSSVLKSLIDKEVFEVKQQQVSRFDKKADDFILNFTLNEEQDIALETIKESFKTKPVTLLHGVTSSGKTLIYIKLIQQAILQGKQVLYLLPEIALTAQIVNRLQYYFADKIMVYHSKFNDNERAEIWQKVLNNECTMILGARSSVFLPFSNLGLIIVDEEHEASFKQYEPAPRYNARDAAIVLSKLNAASILLGSATPSIETYFNAKTQKYGFAQLKNRFGGVKMPHIKIVSFVGDGKKSLNQSFFTNTLIEHIQGAIKNKEQTILFQNRRGYVPIIICKTCGHTPKCVHCDVSLNYHKSSNKLHCHYCGYKQAPIQMCLVCGSAHIEQKGFGTEKVEDDIKQIITDVRVARMDYDTTRNKHGHERILNQFESGEIDILVGTQMVAKGIDFNNVSTIGVINADSLLKFPDFRAYERSFQMLAQVAGRAGRRDKQGVVIIQTYDVQNRILKQLLSNDYEGMVNDELLERKQYHYPPFYRIIKIDLKNKDAIKLQTIANYFVEDLKKHLGITVLGPEVPLVSRIRTYYIQTVLIKIDRQNHSVIRVKQILKKAVYEFYQNKLNKGTLVNLDVDPY